MISPPNSINILAAIHRKLQQSLVENGQRYRQLWTEEKKTVAEEIEQLNVVATFKPPQPIQTHELNEFLDCTPV